MTPTSTPSDTSTARNHRARRLSGIAATVGALAIAGGLGAWNARVPSIAAAQEQKAPSRSVGATTPIPLGKPAVESYADLVARVAPAVVTVRAERTVQQTSMQDEDDLFRRFFGERMPRSPGGQRGRGAPRREGGLGSGVVVTADGYVLTNNHVVEGAQKVRVDFTDGRTLDARVVGTDQPSDLAVLKLEGKGFQTLPMGDSDSARVGDVVLALGNPLGLGQTVTSGIISAKGRSTGVLEDAYEDFIQTDASINKGNSGGALVNLRGELIGINSQILSPSGFNIGIGFAIPSSMAQDVMHQLIKSGKVQRGMLGVTVQGVNAELAKSLALSQTRGAIVSEVRDGSPAARAGVQQGDVILALDGKAIDSSNSLRNRVSRVSPGSTVTLSLLREGRERDVKVTVGEMDRTAAEVGPTDEPTGTGGRYGLSVEPLTPELARELKVKSRTGVIVAEVDPDGAAAEAGLQEGDVIQSVNQKGVSTAGELRQALEAAGKDRPALLLVNRQGRTVFLTLAARNG